jgi:hypothetical protein
MKIYIFKNQSPPLEKGVGGMSFYCSVIARSPTDFWLDDVAISFSYSVILGSLVFSYQILLESYPFQLLSSTIFQYYK